MNNRINNNDYYYKTKLESNHTLLARKVDINIKLTETEIKIKNLLLDFTKHLKDSRFKLPKVSTDKYNNSIDDDMKNNLNIDPDSIYHNADGTDENNTETIDFDQDLELRITGGWVRDKLLGLESNDIDISLNIMTGHQFVSILIDYINENFDKYPNVFQNSQSHSNALLLKENPEKSKHLETTTIELYNQSIDFVNLRFEKYNNKSRIPIMKFGTAKQDSFRRDFTINSLFYNLNNSKIEDFTKNGLKDLKNNLLKTTLNPFIMFKDDPLRILRMIRFSTRFNFKIDNESINTMKLDEIKSSFIKKISNERIGIEIEKILKNSNSDFGISIINEINYYNLIFKLPNENIKTIPSNYKISLIKTSLYLEKSIKLINNNLLSLNHLKYFKIFKINNEYKRLLLLSILLKPWDLINIIDNKNKKIPAIITIIKSTLNFGKNDSELVHKIISHKSKVSDIINSDPSISKLSFTRRSVGLLIKELGEKWIIFITYSLIIDITNNNDDSIDLIIQQYESLLDYIHNEKLQESWKLKQLIDGKDISKITGKKPGPWMKTILEKIIGWQLENANGTKEDCIKNIPNFLE